MQLIFNEISTEAVYDWLSVTKLLHSKVWSLIYIYISDHTLECKSLVTDSQS